MAQSRGGVGAMTAVGAITGGLLSSSCCVLQLLLNWTSIGVCAGFSVFTPYQAHLRLLTVALLARLLLKHGLNRRTLATVMASCLLMTSQDALAAYNRGDVRADVRTWLRRLAGAMPLASPAAMECGGGNVRYNIAVAGLRCEACASRLRGALVGVPGVRKIAVDFGKGTVVAWADANGTVDGAALIDAIHQLDPMHYVASLTGKECFDGPASSWDATAQDEHGKQHEL